VLPPVKCHNPIKPRENAVVEWPKSLSRQSLVMNKESEQIREMMQREMDNQEPWHKRLFDRSGSISQGCKLLTAYTTIRVLHYLSGGMV